MHVIKKLLFTMLISLHGLIMAEEDNKAEIRYSLVGTYACTGLP